MMNFEESQTYQNLPYQTIILLMRQYHVPKAQEWSHINKHMTYEIKTDILTGCLEIGNLHFHVNITTWKADFFF